MQIIKKIVQIMIVLILLSEFISSDEELKISKVRVVDFQYGELTTSDKLNIIFRSDIPEDISHTTFEYDDLVSDMISIAKSEKLIRIEKNNLFILDFTLLADDDALKDVERKYFEKNPDKGILMGWPVLGESLNPDSYTKEEIFDKTKDLSWMEDSIDLWVDEIHKNLNNFTSDKNLVILIHCKYGKDRTGEISGAYQLKYSRLSWEEVSATNWETGNWHITYENQRALTWYCHHLQMHRGYTNLTCTHENLSADKSPVAPKLVGWDKEDSSNGWEIAFWVVFSVALSVFGVIGVGVVLVVAFVVVWRKRANLKKNEVVEECEIEMIEQQEEVDDL